MRIGFVVWLLVSVDSIMAEAGGATSEYTRILWRGTLTEGRRNRVVENGAEGALREARLG